MKSPLSPIELLRTQSLTSVVKAEIEKLILDGELKPGERLNEMMLSARLGVSRGPVREACRALAEAGLAYIIPNRGVFVRSLSEEDAAEVYEVRAGVFGYAGMLLAERVTDEQIARLRELLTPMDEAASRGDFDRYYPLNLEFHDALLKATGNQTLMRTYHGLVRELHLFRTRGLLQGGGLEVSNKEHREIVDAIASRDPIRAFQAAAGHVRSARHRALPGARADD